MKDILNMVVAVVIAILVLLLVGPVYALKHIYRKFKGEP